jgi:hypothetical protein
MARGIHFGDYVDVLRDPILELPLLTTALLVVELCGGQYVAWHRMERGLL